MDRPHVRHGHNLGVDPAADPAACVPEVAARTDGAGTAAVAGLLANRIGLVVIVWNGMDPGERFEEGSAQLFYSLLYS